MTFTYRTIDDQSAESDVVTVTIRVTGVNDAPAAADHGGATDEDWVLDGSDLLTGATDVDTGAVLATVPGNHYVQPWRSGGDQYGRHLLL